TMGPFARKSTASRDDPDISFGRLHRDLLALRDRASPLTLGASLSTSPYSPDARERYNRTEEYRRVLSSGPRTGWSRRTDCQVPSMWRDHDAIRRTRMAASHAGMQRVQHVHAVGDRAPLRAKLTTRQPPEA